MKKKALISSILTIALCLSLIAGSTFALFTSESTVNVAVTSGKVDVKATIERIPEMQSTLEYPLGTATFEGNKVTLDKMVPGDYIEFTINVENKSNVAVSYRTILLTEGEKLMEALKVTVDGNEYTGTKAIVSEYKNDIDTFTSVDIKIELPVETGNDYQDKSCSITYIIEAVQGNANTADFTADEIMLCNAGDLIAFANRVNEGKEDTTFAGKTVKLMNDVDLSGIAWTPIGLEDSLHNNFQGTFDGQGYTIRNMSVNHSESAGFFGFFTGTVKNLKFENATVRGNHWGGVIAGYASYDATVIENCTVNNSTVELAYTTAEEDVGDKAGAIVGYLNGNVTVKDNTVTNTTVTAYRDAGALLGCNGTAASTCVTGNTVSDCRVIHNENYAGEIVGRQINGFVLDTASNTATNVTIERIGWNKVDATSGLETGSESSFKADLSDVIDESVTNGFMIADQNYYTDGTLLTFEDSYATVLIADTKIECKDLIVLDAANTIIFSNCDITIAQGGHLVVDHSGRIPQLIFDNVTINGTKVTASNLSDIVTNYCDGNIFAMMG